jgi:hypothetical protein
MITESRPASRLAKDGTHRGGPRPNSGRPRAVDETILAELARKSTQWAIDSWDTLSDENKLKLTVAFGAKYIPQKVEQSGSIDVKIDEFSSDLMERRKLLGIN